MNKYLIKELVTKMVPAHCLVNSTLGNTDKRINLQDKLRLLTAIRSSEKLETFHMPQNRRMCKPD